ncbi:hypothetical protein SFRURICE_005340 [Spodoptera frugiperda]|nr:hypothetical protein SFRURICE_005340 [Spodoptera frugiperda]
MNESNNNSECANASVEEPRHDCAQDRVSKAVLSNSRKRTRSVSSSSSSSPSSSDSTDSASSSDRKKKRGRHHKRRGGKHSRKSRKDNRQMQKLFREVSALRNQITLSSSVPCGSAEPASVVDNDALIDDNVSGILYNDSIDAYAGEPTRVQLPFNFDIETKLKEPAVPKAPDNLLKALQDVQYFNKSEWSEVRYSEVQKSYCHTPGFVDLEANEEIRAYDQLPATLVRLYALTKAYARYSPFDKITEVFSNGDFQKVSSDLLQLICGHRAEILQMRRDGITNHVRDPLIKATLRKIPPSDRHLFENESFTAALEKMGGVKKAFVATKTTNSRIKAKETVNAPESPLTTTLGTKTVSTDSIQFRAGQLALFYDRWEEMGEPPNLSCAAIITGYRIPFLLKPPLMLPNLRKGPYITKESKSIDGARGLEVWGWAESLTGWNEDQIRLLRSSWRTSTLKTYKVAWDRWVSWSKKYNLDPFHPTGPMVARYLADLYLINKLSYNTILVHKSVVATLCNAEDAGQISSHTLVKHVLKSIALKKPVTHKPPVWNIDTLTSFLSSNTVDENNPFAASRHTATLLLLCSGRRVHDLTLLLVDSDHCVDDGSNIILKPMFGSKTDSDTHRQSGWRLLPNTTCKNLDPVFWALPDFRLHMSFSFTLIRLSRSHYPHQAGPSLVGGLRTFSNH